MSEHPTGHDGLTASDRQIRCTMVPMESVIGQGRAVQVLQAALRSGRVPHAFIFHGPAGVGKYTTACALARVLLCHQPVTNLAGSVEACGGCQACRFDATPGDPDDRGSENSAPSVHPDLHVIRKELAAASSNPVLRKRKQMNIPIDVLRQWMLGGTTSDDRVHSSLVYQTACVGHGKVFIIDEAHLLDMHGQNALLKVMEEPPPSTYLILVTAREDRLLMTIRSRCQRVAFVPLPAVAIYRWLEAESNALTEQQRAWLVDFAGGSLGLAHLALQYELHAWAPAILPAIDELANKQFDAQLGAEMAQRIDGFAKDWVDRHANASKDAANKRGADLMWTMIAQHARKRLAQQARQAPHDHPLAAEETVGPWLGVIDALSQAQRALASHVNLSLVTDHLVAQMHESLAVGSAGHPAALSSR